MGRPGGQRGDDTVGWLLTGDTAVRLQTSRDLLDDEPPELQGQVALDGDAATILSAQVDGRWGRAFYQPKWTSSHYALLELRDLAVAPDHPVCVRAVATALRENVGADGGLNPTDSVQQSDVCMNGMFLAFSCYFGADARSLESIVDFVLGQEMSGGGFNCRTNRSGARVASVHTTTSVVDGFAEYLRCGYTYRSSAVRRAVDAATEVLLVRRLYQRRGDGEPIREELTRLHHPARWHFDVLRGLDVLRSAGVAYDPRLDAALGILRSRRHVDGRWAGAAQYPGRTYVRYPHAGEPNRWVTLRALRSLRYFDAARAAA